MANPCLTNIIGLTRTKCNCPKIDGVLSDYNVSDSSFYIGDEINVVDTVFTDCSNTSFLASLQTIRDRAENEFMTDIQSQMMNFGYKTKGGYTGNIGDTKWNGTTTGGTYSGVILRGAGLKGSSLTIKSLVLGWSTSAENIAISIYEGDSYSLGTLIETVNVVTLANQFVSISLSQSRIFDLSDLDKRIYIIYTGQTSGVPLNTKDWCKCGGNAPHWLNFLSSHGFYSTQNTAPQLFSGNGEYMQGLLLGSDVKCDGLNWMCSVTSETSVLKKVVAKAILFKATSLTAQFILDQQNINFFTLLHREALYGKRNHAEKEYGEILKWLALEIPKENAACFICQSNTMRLVPTLI